MINLKAQEIISKLNAKYGEDFHWFLVDNPRVYEEELQRELALSHPLKPLILNAIAKSERSDDVLFSDGKKYYAIRLTWSANEHSHTFNNPYPTFFSIEKADLEIFLEQDFLEN